MVIQGAGLLGIYGCALLHEAGVANVFCVDVQASRLAHVANFGGIPIDGRPHHYPNAHEAIHAVAPHGVDAVLEVAGVSALVPEGIRLLNRVEIRYPGFHQLGELPMYRFARE